MSARRPVVGITTTTGPIVAGAWEQDAAYSPMPYVRSAQAAGARALLLVPDPRDADEPADLLSGIDALVLSGGAGDVHPDHYGAPLDPRTHPEEPVRDRFELALARAARDGGLPVLGICRGMQVLNVAHGGTLVQHLPDAVGHDRHRRLPSGYADHAVELAEGSLAARAVGARRTGVRSHHHQGVDAVGEGLVASAWTPEDGVVEAIEAPGDGFRLGVLWHPEEDERSRVMGALVSAATHQGRAAPHGG